MKKFACVVVTFFPDKDSIDHLKKISNQADLLVVIDNTPNCANSLTPHGSNIVFISNGENLGLSAALNRGIRIAGQKGFENIFLLDQDSRITESFFVSMLDFKDRMDNLTDRCGLYVPDMLDRNSGSHCSFPVIRRFSFHHYTRNESIRFLLSQGLIAITSGSLLPYSKYLTIGPLIDDYFIDFIDNEYCLRLSNKSYLVAVNFDTVLDHAIGNRTQESLFGISIKPNHHAPIRRYFISRNGIRTAIRYFGIYPSFMILLSLRLVHELLSILFFEDNKYQKEAALILGCIDGILGRMGRCQRSSIIINSS